MLNILVYLAKMSPCDNLLNPVCYLLQYLSEHGSAWSTHQVCCCRWWYGWQNLHAYLIYDWQFSWWICSNSVSAAYVYY